MIRRRALYAILAAVGLAVYLWPAFVEPIVLWADSRTDLAWAKEGIGLWKPLRIGPGDSAHPLKPGYLLFLRAATAALPFLEEARAVLVVESILLFAAIAAVAAVLGRRHGMPTGVAAYALLILFVPLKNSASLVMPEAFAAALVLALVFLVSEGPPSTRRAVAAGLALTALFWVRPNVAGIVLVLLCLRWAIRKEPRAAVQFLGTAIAAIALLWFATRPVAGSDAARAFPDAILFGSAEYGWWPSLRPIPAARQTGSPSSRLGNAKENWSRTLDGAASDRDRELLWRGFHSILGVEYYDSRWSPTWRAFQHAGRVAAPFLVLACLAGVITAGDRESRLLGGALLAALVFQNLLIGSAPRFAVPLLPILLVLAARAATRERRLIRRRVVLSLGVFVVFVIAAALQPSLLSWDWGQIEAPGITIEQRIPKGSLPRVAPATLHVRVAPPEPAMAAGLEIALGGRVLHRSTPSDDRSRPTLSIPLPDDLLRANGERPLVLRLTSTGDYGTFSFLLFSVVPSPWRRGARRVDSEELSPASDVVSGALDWWAHSGEDVPRPPPASR